jgi:4-aminobutyrate aminotransferase / (S)-3-amino-2-methylpropionate transaminase / 5-aminovalerate transaminase
MAQMRSISVRAAIPGPRSLEILERKRQVVAEPLSIAFPIVVAEASGALVTDVDGNVFLDFTGGVGCLNAGHAAPRVVDAVQEQAARFHHTDFTVLPYEPYIELAERLVRIAPLSGDVRVALFNSGAEAIENAIKIAKCATGRSAVIAFDGGFHGRTLMALSLTSKTHPYKAGMGPFAPEVYRVPFADPYRGPDAESALAQLRQAFATRVAAEQVAAVVFEPVQGEAGFVVPPVAFVRGIRALCDEHGIAMIADEVQTGFCRTGRMFAIEHFGVEPDLITVAKSIAGGLPLSGVIGHARLMNAPPAGAIGGTFPGNPLACAAGIAVLDTIEEAGLVERAEAIGSVIRGRMESWHDRYEAIGDVRGLGAMLAIELVRSREARAPAPELASAIIEAAAARGLLLLKAGLDGNCIRVLVPLVIPDFELEEALDVWENALEAVLVS